MVLIKALGYSSRFHRGYQVSTAAVRGKKFAGHLRPIAATISHAMSISSDHKRFLDFHQFGLSLDPRHSSEACSEEIGPRTGRRGVQFYCTV